MNKFLKYGLIGALCLGALWAAAFFVKSNSKSSITYDTTTAFIASIEKKTVATGKVVPEDEVAIKPQISGIIDVIYLEEGTKVKAGDLIAKVKVVPNEQSLNSAQGRVKNSKISLDNVTIEFKRNKELFEKGVISSQDFNTQKLRMDQATLELENAKADFEIIKLGSAGGSATANTNVRATVSGTILEIPVKEGDQVIQPGGFNDGTTIATIADLSIMIFEGKVDEGEVGKLAVGMPLEISLGAIEDKTFEARLKFIAPKGVEEAGTVQFKIEGDVKVEDDFLIRAGYSANASLILERKEDILVISEALLQFDRDTDKPFVEVSIGEQEF
ncbi:MAG: efflux RND transporter periplasmic adaptor subunit, partial [Flavobacteriaceae bacterium]|nr:efflux RND transporter periplasmic adaptor subunit [Flavobacteriaceae bacterium]